MRPAETGLVACAWRLLVAISAAITLRLVAGRRMPVTPVRLRSHVSVSATLLYTALSYALFSAGFAYAIML
jgi:hypothetical protein